MQIIFEVGTLLGVAIPWVYMSMQTKNILSNHTILTPCELTIFILDCNTLACMRNLIPVT